MRAQHGFLVAGLIVGLGTGCDTMAEPVAEGDVRFVPTDERPAQQALVDATPISGGTLTISSDGRVAIAADPERNRVSIVNLQSRSVVHQVALNPGDEPGRVTIDNDRGVAHVALRSAGEVAAIDLASGSVLRRAAACPAPRGAAFDGTSDTVFVACADGQLVALSAGTGEERWRERIAVDLRDVVVTRDELVVTRFKSAEAIRVTKQGIVVSKSQASSVEHVRNGASHNFDANAAWRAVGTPEGEVVVVHQRAQVDVVGPAPSNGISAPPSPVYYGGGDTLTNCDSIVHGAITTFGPDGRAHLSGPISDAVMPVDVAVSGDWIAIAVAGSPDANAPRPFTVNEFGSVPPRTPVARTEVIRVSRSSLSVEGDAPSIFGCGSAAFIAGDAQVTAVAFAPNGDLVYQVREPAALMVRALGGVMAPTPIELGGISVADTGHDLFHKDSGNGIACASCHMEGGDDGRVWKFNEIGDRRTQAVNIGLEDTAPFHWDGDIDNLHDLMGQVFVNRMGGVHQSPERLNTLSDWMFGVNAPAPPRAAEDLAAVRGRELFHSEETECATCHDGEKLTDNRTLAVGTGSRDDAFQTPSLIGVAYRAPFLHDGCAGTLRERFTNEACGGGDRHGKTSQLTDTQLDDLIAYMESL